MVIFFRSASGALQKSKIFEGGSSDPKLARNVNTVIAFVFGLFVVAAYNIVSVIQELIVKTVLIVIFILCDAVWNFGR